MFPNCELSLLKFQRRVLNEALDGGNPLLERLKYLAIFGSNKDVFFMVHVSYIRNLHKLAWMDRVCPATHNPLKFTRMPFPTPACGEQ